MTIQPVTYEEALALSALGVTVYFKEMANGVWHESERQKKGMPPHKGDVLGVETNEGETE